MDFREKVSNFDLNFYVIQNNAGIPIFYWTKDANSYNTVWFILKVPFEYT